jgi:hypothetical protein
MSAGADDRHLRNVVRVSMTRPSIFPRGSATLLALHL